MGVVVVAIAVIVISLVSRANRKSIYEEIKPTIPAQTVVDENGNYKSPIDFTAMKAINEDIYAWITLPDTTIDYPIVQGDGPNGDDVDTT